MRRLLPVLALTCATGCPSSSKPADQRKATVIEKPALAAGTVRSFTPIGENVIATSKPPPKVVVPKPRELEGLVASFYAVHSPAKPAGSGTVEATSLSTTEASRLLARLPALPTRPSDTKAVALRPGPKPPAPSGLTASNAFASVGPGAPSVTAKGLRVLRYAPEGKIDRTGGVSVTFSDAMRPLTSHDKLAASGVPVTVSPAIKGKWRWIDTRTVILEPSEKLPRATRYKIEIPAGTKAMNGRSLAKATRWTFETPPPTIARKHPSYGPQPLDPVLIVGFDQKIEPGRVISKITLRTQGNKRIPVTLLPKDQYAAHKIEERTRYWAKGTWLAFRGTAKLPPNESFTVVVAAGTPSAEGPLVTTKEQSWGLRTYGPLQLQDLYCGSSCRPEGSFVIRFNNPIPKKAAQRFISIRPRPKTTQIDGSGRWYYIRIKDKKAGQRFRVSVNGKIRDVFGQSLGKTVTKKFTIKPSGYYGDTLKGEQFVVTEPIGRRADYNFLSVMHKGFRVKVYKVTPADHDGFVAYMRHFYRQHRGYANYYYRYGGSQERKVPVGKLVVNKTVRARNPNELTVHSIDLRRALRGGVGHAVVEIEALDVLPRRNKKEGLLAWVQVTKIGLTSISDETGTIAMASSLANGKPLAGVNVSLLSDPSRSVATGKDGLAKINAYKTKDSVLLATKGKDSALMPWRGRHRWRLRPAGKQLVWHVFDDRKLYRPGEKVHIKGWVRGFKRTIGGDIELSGARGQNVSYQIKDPQGIDIAKGVARVDGLDGFSLAFQLPEDVNLGYGRIQFDLPKDPNVSDRRFRHTFRIEEFRRPEFEVSTTVPPGHHIVGSKTRATVKASYYTGGPLADAKTLWSVRVRDGHYTPPNQGAFWFGREDPWWRHYHRWRRRARRGRLVSGKTDAKGVAHLGMSFDKIPNKRTMVVHAEASVTDVNRQMWTSGTRVIVHPSSLYVGLRPRSRFLDPGTLAVDTIVTDLDGKPVVGRKVLVTATPHASSKSPVPKTCQVTSKKGAVQCTLDVSLPGLHELTAEVTDDQNRTHQARLYLWINGGKLPGESNLRADRVQLTPDKKTYRPGDTAKLLVRAPFHPAEGVAVISKNGVLSRQRFKMTSSTKTLTVPLGMKHAPSVHVSVSLVGSAQRRDAKGKLSAKLPRRPAHANGGLRLAVTPVERILSVTVSPATKALEPGAKTSVSVRVRDWKGRVVPAAEVTLVAVDESVLALGNYKIPDPTSTFYSHYRFGSGISREDIRRWVRLKSSKQLRREVAAKKPAPSVAGAGTKMTLDEGKMGKKRSARGDSAKESDDSGGGKDAVAVRKNFSPLAVFAPTASTNREGVARIDFKLPDNLTRYRVTAVVASGTNRFGKGESSITARRLLMVRPSAPRFLSFGDRFELPVVVQNLSAQPQQVKLAARARNLKLTDTWGWSFTVPGSQRVEVRFPAATRSAGKARVQLIGVSSTTPLSDAAEVSFPVWTPATSEAFAVYGHLDEGGIKQPIAPPPNTIPSIGGLDVTTSSTALYSLTDAVHYLLDYPYDGSEQLASRIISIASLDKLLPMFKTDQIDAAQMRKRIRSDIKSLQSRQSWSGGFHPWSSLRRDYPYISVHAAHALFRAKAAGYKVDKRKLERSKKYLWSIKRRLPKWYPTPVKEAIEAYALYVLASFGPDQKRARKQAIALARITAKAPVEAKGWLLAAIADDKSPGGAEQRRGLIRHLTNRVTETAQSAYFATSYADGGHLVMHSRRRADSIALDGLIAAQPKSDLIPKVVKGLMSKRVKGRWLSTQENAFVLLALARYFRTYEKATPDLVAGVWLGGKYAGERAFKGRTNNQHKLHIPMTALVGAKTRDLIVHRKGQGRLYYRLGLSYAPASLKAPPASHGFVIERRYQGADRAEDVKRDKDGTWRIRAGARVRVVLSMVASARRYHVALVDGMPAGLEALNPALATTSQIRRDRRSWRWWSYWFDHQNLRDERVEVFASQVYAGVYTYSYLTRATTPGTFTAPPAKAEELYSPETFGRSSTDRVVVE